jgi:alpha-D-xyloside xylohydrolase
MMRHPFLYYPHEPEAWRDDASFFLGGSLYASAVVQRGATVKETWLPPGKWVDLADLVVYDGGRRVTIPAPLTKLPLLVKDGAMVPLLDASIDTLAPTTDPTVISPAQVADRLDVVVALSPGKEARMVLADGTVLVARRKATGGVVSGLPAVPLDQVPMCTGAPADQGCLVATEEGMVSRLRVTTPRVAASDLAHDDLELSAHGPLARRVRWDVMRTH